MFLRPSLCLLAGLALTVSAYATTDIPAKTLRMYGPGGPHHVLEECAELFQARHGIEVEVIRAFPHILAEKLPEDGDLYYGGAEYMLDNFHRDNPGVLDIASAERLHPRRIGIIVRKGNPLNIGDLDDLAHDSVQLLDVHLENMDRFYRMPHNGIGNIRQFEYTGRQGVRAWRTNPELDAWITYQSWHLLLENDSEFIPIPGEQALRYIPVALTARTEQPQQARAFIAFLKSDEARRIFSKHGWE